MYCADIKLICNRLFAVFRPVILTMPPTMQPTFDFHVVLNMKVLL